MTDFKTMTQVFDKAGIMYETKIDDAGCDLLVYGGYAGFYTTFTFNSEGKLETIGAWE